MTATFMFVYRRESSEGARYLKRQDGSLTIQWTADIHEAERIYPNRVVEFVEDSARLRREFPGKLVFMVCDDAASARDLLAPAHRDSDLELRRKLELETMNAASLREDVNALRRTLAQERDAALALHEKLSKATSAWEETLRHSAETLKGFKL